MQGVWTKCVEMNRLIDEACALGHYQRAWEATRPIDIAADDIGHQIQLVAVFFDDVRTAIDNDRPGRAADALVGLEEAVANLRRLLPTAPR